MRGLGIGALGLYVTGLVECHVKDCALVADVNTVSTCVVLAVMSYPQ